MTTNQAQLLLAIVLLTRGQAIVFSKILLADFSNFNLLGVRFLLSFLLLVIFFYKRVKNFTKADVGFGIITGTFFAVTMTMEMYALHTVSIGVISFLENSAIVLVPLFNYLIFRERFSKITFMCSLLAFAGIGIMCFSKDINGNAIGVVSCLLGACCYAGAIIMNKRGSFVASPFNIGVFQLGTMGLETMILSFIFEKPILPYTWEQVGCFAFLIILCSCFGFTYQAVAQQYMSAQRASLMCGLNPLYASILGYIIYNELFDAYKLIGCTMILVGILLPNLLESKQSKQ